MCGHDDSFPNIETNHELVEENVVFSVDNVLISVIFWGIGKFHKSFTMGPLLSLTWHRNTYT